LVHRATSIRRVRQKDSLDAPPSVDKPSGSSEEESHPRRLRRFSLLSDNLASPLKSPHGKDEPDPVVSIFLKNIERSLDCFSTSVGVSMEPPSLVIALAEKEKRNPGYSLTGDEKAGLTSILGWSERASLDSATGTVGFVRHQEISFLYSKHVPSTSPSQTPASSFISIRLAPRPSIPNFSTCGRPRWETYRYYSHGRRADQPLGEVITDLCFNSEKPCITPGCVYKSGQHQHRFVHGGLRIVMNVNTREGGDAEDVESIEVWLGCKICNGTTKPSQMNDGT
jgi:1-phosphatidylinositol-3-phosphate 5-kinase